MLGYFLANRKSSADYDIYLTDANVYGVAERDVEPIEVSGRNGNLLIDNGRYKNKAFSYPCIIRDHFIENFTAFINYLQAQSGYIRLEDSFYPEYYIMARYVGETNPYKVVTEARDGVFDLTFDRKPQRFLKEGETAITMTISGAIRNVYQMTALPTVRVYGTGYVIIGGIKITINSVDEYVDIDCETQNAYKGSINCNGNITLNDGKFFELTSGNNSITLNGVSRVEIKPNWWIL